MKRTTLCGIVLLMSVLWAGVSFAFDSGSTGVDGAFAPTENTVLQLPSDGIFNFTTVDIPSGVTVTFSKNATNTPVYILATGDVNIAGTIDVSGSQPLGGAGGYDGGYGGYAGQGFQSGLGPGGGSGGGNGKGGGFGTVGGCAGGGPTYSNINIVPFIGGSGGGSSVWGSNGGGGGGAVLIASSGTVNITGSISANGSSGRTYGGGGSGGAIKIIASTIAGNGSISATGGTGYAGAGQNCSGGAGRIRLETDTRDTFLMTAATSPDFSWGQSTSVIINDPTMPGLRITSISGTAAPSSPGGSYSNPDMTLVGTVNPVQIAIEASNIPVGSTVTVSATPYSGSNVETTVMLSGTLESSSATAELTLDVDNPNITYVILAYTTFTMQTAMYYEGEKVERAMVAAGAAGGGQVTYITSSGREIPAEMLMASLR